MTQTATGTTPRNPSVMFQEGEDKSSYLQRLDKALTTREIKAGDKALLLAAKAVAILWSAVDGISDPFRLTAMDDPTTVRGQTLTALAMVARPLKEEANRVKFLNLSDSEKADQVSNTSRKSYDVEGSHPQKGFIKFRVKSQRLAPSPANPMEGLNAIKTGLDAAADLYKFLNESDPPVIAADSREMLALQEMPALCEQFRLARNEASKIAHRKNSGKRGRR